MPRTEVISVFSNEALDLNASARSDLIDLGKCGPSTRFWGDFTASGAGRVSVNQLVGNTDDDTFYLPTPASLCLASFLGGDGNASRERYELDIIGTRYLQFRAWEQNASHMVFSMNLIMAQE